MEDLNDLRRYFTQFFSSYGVDKRPGTLRRVRRIFNRSTKSREDQRKELLEQKARDQIWKLLVGTKPEGGIADGIIYALQDKANISDLNTQLDAVYNLYNAMLTVLKKRQNNPDSRPYLVLDSRTSKYGITPDNFDDLLNWWPHLGKNDKHLVSQPDESIDKIYKPLDSHFDTLLDLTLRVITGLTSVEKKLKNQEVSDEIEYTTIRRFRSYFLGKDKFAKNVNLIWLNPKGEVIRKEDYMARYDPDFPEHRPDAVEIVIKDSKVDDLVIVLEAIKDRLSKLAQVLFV